MPTYEYACTACGHRLEAVQSFSDEPLTSCPECGGALRKVYGAVGIVLKGSGFYKTDSRAAGSKGNGRKATATESSGVGLGSRSGSGSGPRLGFGVGILGRRVGGHGKVGAVLERQRGLGQGSRIVVVSRLVGRIGHQPGRRAGRDGTDQSPPRVISATASVCPAATPGSQRRSAPISTTDCSMRWSVDATVTSRTG